VVFPEGILLKSRPPCNASGRPWFG
jgi:hypothetical protein